MRNFFKIELWTPDDRVERMLYAGSNLDRVRKIFADKIGRQPASLVTSASGPACCRSGLNDL